VVSGVSDSLQAVQDFVRHVQILQFEAGNDTFRFALFHMQGTTRFWDREAWYRHGTQPLLVMNDIGHVCKAAAWFRLPPGMVATYDYVWLLDGDLILDLFSWQLYRTVLMIFKPLVSQPSVLPRDVLHGLGRSTDIKLLRMQNHRGELPVAVEVPRTEVMAPMINTSLWPIVYSRLLKNDNAAVSTVSDTWDAAAFWHRLVSNGTGPLLVNAAPVLHMDSRTIPKSLRVRGKGDCARGCGSTGSNCRPLSDDHNMLPLIQECDTRTMRDCLRILSGRIGTFRSVSVNSSLAVVYQERRCEYGKLSNKSFFNLLGTKELIRNTYHHAHCSKPVPANVPWLPE
jgi:hypothetical protein